MIFKRSEWNALISEINAIRQNPPDGCDALGPIELYENLKPFAKSEVRRVRDALKATCSSIEFPDLATPQLITQRLIDDIRNQLANAWCDCEEDCEPLPCPFANPTEINLGWSFDGTLFGGSFEYWFWPAAVNGMTVMEAGYKNGNGFVVVREKATGNILTPFNSDGIFWQGVPEGDGVGESIPGGNGMNFNCTGVIDAQPAEQFLLLGANAAADFEVILRLSCSNTHLPCCDDEDGGGGGG